MSTITAPAGLVRISAPLPKPREYTLLDAAQLVTPGSDRWLAGAWVEGFPPGPAFTHDPCSLGSYRLKSEAGVLPQPMFGSFTVYLPAQCQAKSIGPDKTEWTDRLRLVFEAYEAAAVERVLATGDGHATLGPYLTDGNLEVLDSSGVSPLEGLALLEQLIADRGGDGIIHVTPAVATYWYSLRAVETARGQMQTGLGTRVAVGAGYIGAGAASSGEEWAYATGPVQITRGDIFVNPADYSQALDRSSNEVLFFAERRYLLNWVGRIDPSDDNHIQAGVLIDRSAT